VMHRILTALAGTLLALFLFPAVAGAATPGAPDRSFSGGHVITKMGNLASSIGWAGLDAKRRIVAVGGALDRRKSGDRSQFALARYRGNGKLDRDFASNGKLHFSPGSGNAFAEAGAIDGLGRILAAGGRCVEANPEKGCRFMVARFKPSGRIDRSFGAAGTVTTAFGADAEINSMALDHGRIVVAGFAGDEIALARYRANGHLDSSFGTGGTVTVDGRAGEAANSVAIDSRGRIVVAGGPGFALTRFTPDGELDRSFGRGGTVTTDFGTVDMARSVVIGGHGRIVAAGSSQQGTAGHRRYRFAVARYLPNGHLDRSFSHDGKTKTTFSPFRDEATTVAIDSRGRVVAAGYASGFDLAIARYDPDGRLDRSFGKRGLVRDPIDNGAIPSSVLIDARDRIVTAGGIDNEFGLARFIGYRHS
jgi:uncharacterized delta-60 repeat protein